MYHKTIKVSNGNILGYKYFYDLDHPLANKSGIVYYHRHVVSEKIGRWLKSSEHIHHIDGNRSNNSLNNLKIITLSDHAKIHNPDKRKTIKCHRCGIKTKNKKYCSQKCSKIARRIVDRPSKNQLLQEIDTMTWTSIGKKYGVSDNTIRKWAKGYKII